MFFYQTDFDFTSKTKHLINQKFNYWYKNYFDHDIEYKTIRQLFTISSIVQELSVFLKTFDINFDYHNINAFISNYSTYTKTNPHVDVLHKGHNYLPIKSRFNVMVKGNPYDPMIWWEHFKFGNPNHIKQKFTYFGHEYESLSIPGSTVPQRLDYLGAHSCIKHNLLTPSAFVNTSIAHALELSPGPRLIISVQINKDIQDYCRSSTERITLS